MLSNRQGLIVWIHTLKQVRQLRRFGNVQFASKKLKYVVIYCDNKNIDNTVEKIASLHFVKKVDYSYKQSVKTEYENSKPDKAKEYDYKIGL